MSYEFILIETPADGVGLIRLNRPQALNALNQGLMREVKTALQDFDADPAIGCMVITGSEKAFAAGADIKEMDGQTQIDMLMQSSLIDGFDFSDINKPIIAAVSGWALGGGCELSMMCDMIIASETAAFGQPEINLGVIPGGGGTQRLTKAVGKALAMEIMLADRKLKAEEALQYGLVNRVVSVESYLDEAIQLAQKVAGMSQVAVRLTKDAINKAYETTLQEGLEVENRNFLLSFSSEDKAEGMKAFIEKAEACMETPLDLTILYTCNIRGDLHLLPRLYTYIERLKTDMQGNKLLLLDLGESCNPEIWHCKATGGRSTLIVLDGMGFHAANVAGMLATPQREKVEDIIIMQLVDEHHTWRVKLPTWQPEGINVTCQPVDDPKLRLQIIMIPAEDTHILGNQLHLQTVEAGQVGTAHIRLSDMLTLTEQRVFTMSPETLPNATIVGAVEFVEGEARYFMKQQNDK